MNTNQLVCFVCSQSFPNVHYFSDTHDDLNEFEKHILQAHQIVIPKFRSLETTKQFLNGLGDLKQLELNDRLSKLVMSRYEDGDYA